MSMKWTSMKWTTQFHSRLSDNMTAAIPYSPMPNPHSQIAGCDAVLVEVELVVTVEVAEVVLPVLVVLDVVTVLGEVRARLGAGACVLACGLEPQHLHHAGHR